MDSTDYNYSSLSELDSLSDSDWLDIASSRASEDEDGFDSDRFGLDSRPDSRLSSIASSRDDVVEGWEGLLEDSSDETPLADPDTSLVLTASTIADGGHTQDRVSSPVQDEDPEDERVKAALDQSMMSTLSSSRPGSLSNSMQTSIVHSTRSLRLSFPDPTTSRLQSLNTSFEDLSPEDADVSSSEAAPEQDNVEEHVTLPLVSTADPDTLSTSEIPEHNEVRTDVALPTPNTATPDFYVFLYGSSPVAKFKLVNMLLKKWALSSSRELIQTVSWGSHTMIHEFEATDSTAKPEKQVVTVIDKTGFDNPPEFCELNRPSIAIVFLPSALEISLPNHTLYLPVIMSSPDSLVDTLQFTDYFLEAEQQWDSTDISPHKLTSFSGYSSPVIDQEVLENATPSQVAQAFRPLLPSSHKTVVVPKVSAHALTMFAILSIVLGYIVHGSLNASGLGGVADKTTHICWLVRPAVTVMAANKSLASPMMTIGSSNVAVATAPYKHLDVAVFEPTPATLSTSQSVPLASTSATGSASTASQVRAPTAMHECDCGCGLLTWPGKTETNTDVILRPTASGLTAKMESITSLSIFSSHTQHKDNGKGKAKATAIDTSFYALSTRVVTSLSEYFGFTPAMHDTEAEAEEDTDIQELMNAIDELVYAIHQQTATLWERSHSTISTIQEKLGKRNAKAKHRAKQMRAAGERWVSSVKERIISQTELAKENARMLRERVEVKHKFAKSKVQVRKRRWSETRMARRIAI